MLIIPFFPLKYFKIGGGGGLIPRTYNTESEKKFKGQTNTSFNNLNQYQPASFWYLCPPLIVDGTSVT